MGNGITEITGGQVETVFNLLSSSLSLQIAFTVLIVGIIIITTIYRKFSSWTRSQKFNYTKPHLANFLRIVLLPCFALALVSSINMYIQVFEPFDEGDNKFDIDKKMTARETFIKIINTINVIVIGYTISQIIPIILSHRELSILEHANFDAWKMAQGFTDDNDELFYRLFEWIPPKIIPNEITSEQFKKYLMHEDGRKFLQRFRTSSGMQIGSYKPMTKDPFIKWRASEDKKYLKYYISCINGNNKSGKKLKRGAAAEEIYNKHVWENEKQLNNFEMLIPGSKPPGYIKKKNQFIPRSINQIIPLVVFASTIISIISWWGIDLVVLATATGGLALGVGLALKETIENYFAYVLIRKDRILKEEDMIMLNSNYSGYVHRITPRVTYIRHPLNESLAIIPTKMLVTNQIINYTKETTLFPVIIKIGVSYLNDPKQVASILIKIGNIAMVEIKDKRGAHLIRQNNCPYIKRNKQSCGCDKDIHIDIKQPVVRFDGFNASSLDFTMWIYVKEYGNQFKVKSDIHMIIFEEFKKYDIRIPWPIRTIYQSDEKVESEEIAKLDDERSKIVKKFGVGDLKL